LINLTFPRENSQLFQCAFHVTGILLRFVADMDCSAKSRSAPDSSAVLVHLSKIIWQAFIRRLLVDASLTNSVWYENPRASAWGPVRRQCWLCVSCSFNTDSTKSLSRGILSSLLKGYPVPVSFVFPNTHLFFRKEYFYGRTPPWAYPSMGVPLHGRTPPLRAISARALPSAPFRVFDCQRSAIELGLFGDYLENGEDIISLSSNPLGGIYPRRFLAFSSQGPLLSSQVKTFSSLQLVIDLGFVRLETIHLLPSLFPPHIGYWVFHFPRFRFIVYC